MYRILSDIQTGANVLLGIAEGEPVSVSDLPPEIAAKVEKFGHTLLGAEHQLTEGHKGFLMDLLNHAVEALSDEPSEPHEPAAANGGAPAGGEGETAPASATEPETAPASEVPAEPAQGAAGGQAAAAEAAGQPGDVPTEPVTAETLPAGEILCPECVGLRTVVSPGGAIVTCNTCNGRGSVVPQAPEQAPASA